MNRTAFLKPAKGRLARHPDGRALAEKGETVAIDGYWQRRIDDEDVVESDPPAPAKSKSTTSES